MPEHPIISVPDLGDRLTTARETLVVLDATTHLDPPTDTERWPARSGRDTWLAEHVPGSRHLDLLTAVSDPAVAYHFSVAPDERLERTLRALGVVDGVEVVVYDSTDGFWAARAWWMLRDLGLPVRVLDGGLAAWRSAGRPVEAGDRPPATPDGPLTLRPGRTTWADLDDVTAIVEGRADGQLVCALGAEQFRGVGTTRYPRAGHIPGSRNLPAGSLRDAADGRLLDPDAVRSLAEPVLGAPGSQPTVLYCGAGISAAGLALGLVAAGYDDLRVYDGSLEEWTADGSRPMAVGD
ncbi:sulfurtransferase [Nakamurella leprariae]|uniref:Sulfurtransferase n=1 Tax=Nakamurella leprariae TaxID=2803911 RepID=A0A938Y9Z5_9ACTN|nr:rhodanese-like domain-containing protein [Nakamurella leprariae]MBM9466697.1 sulfurtransferase [Nakamurella leprariae]